MKTSERGWVRGAVVIGIAGIMMAIALFSPALAVRLATTSYVKQKVNQAFNQSLNTFVQQPVAVFRSEPINVIANGGFASASIGCPAGGAAVGGGASGASANEDWDLEASYPSNGATSGAGATGWSVVMTNESTLPLNFRVYVVCAGASTFTNFTPGSTPVRTNAEWAPASAPKPTVVTRSLPR
jgi:hypothetical protein